MPEDAFYDGLPSKCEIVVISCPWLTDLHPDPWGHHLRIIAPPLIAMLKAIEEQQRESASTDPTTYRTELAVFWDYPSRESLAIFVLMHCDAAHDSLMKGFIY